MKKYIISWSIVSVVCVFLLSACGAATTTTGASTTPDQASAVDALKNSQPKTQAGIQWTVKTITGNDFTIETIDMSSNPLFQQMQSADFRTKMQTMTDTERQALMTQFQEARASAKKILVDVTIPVGVPILIRTGRGGNGAGGFPGGGRWGAPGGGQSAWIGSSLAATPTTAKSTPTASSGKQGTIADIKVGSTISVWLAENTGDRKIASWVSLSPAQTGGTGGGGFSGGGTGNRTGTGGTATAGNNRAPD